MSQSASESVQAADLVGLGEPEEDEVAQPDLTERIAEALSRHRSGWFLLVGGPGTGKSVLLSQLHRRLRTAEGFERVCVLVHSFRRASRQGRAMAVVARALDREIRRVLRLRGPSSGMLFETVRQLGAGSSGRPALLLVLDGLDAARFTQGEGLEDYLPADLPDGVQVVCASWRTGELDYFRASGDCHLTVDLDAKESASSNAMLVRRYWDQQQQRFPQQFPKEFALAAAKACGGQILYAAMLSRWAKVAGRVPDLGTLPTDLTTFLDMIWDDFKGQPFVESAMGYFCASREPLTRGDLQALTGWSALEVAEVLERIEPLLRDERGVDICVAIFHEAFRDHLVLNFYAEDLRKYHERFVELLEPTVSQLLAGPVPGSDPRCRLLADYAHHLLRSGHIGEAVSLASSVDFLAGLAEVVGVPATVDVLRATSAVQSERQACLRLVYAEVSQQIFRLLLSTPSQIGSDIASVVFNGLALAGWPQHEIRRALTFARRAPVLRLLRPAQTTTGWKNAFSLSCHSVVALAASLDELDVFFVLAGNGRITRNNARSGAVEDLQTLSPAPTTGAFAMRANALLFGTEREMRRLNVLTGDLSKLGVRAAGVAHCAVAADASWGASVDTFGNIAWWGKADEPPQPTPRVSGTVTCVTLSDAPPRIAVVSEGSAHLFDKFSKETHTKLGEGVLSAAFSNDGKVIALCTIEGELELVELDGLGASRSWRAHQGAISACAIAGDRIITGGLDRTVAVWTWEGKLLDRFRGHLFGITRVAVTREAKHILSAGTNGAVLSWAMPAGEVREPPASWLDCSVVRPAVPSQRSRPIQSLPIVAYLASVSGDRRLRLWIGTEQDFTRRTLGPARFQCCAISSGADWVAAGTTTGEVFLYSTAGAKPVSSGQVHDAAVRACAWTVDQQRFATVGDDRKVVVHRTNGESSVLGVHKAEVRACAFNDELQAKLFTVASDGELAVWKLGQHRPMNRAHLESPGLCCARLGSSVVIGCEDGSVVSWDGSAAPVSLFSYGRAVEAVAVVGVGLHVVVGGNDEAISAWDIEHKVCVGRLFTPARVLCIHADDDLIVAGDAAGNLYAVDFVAPSSVGSSSPAR